MLQKRTTEYGEQIVCNVHMRSNHCYRISFLMSSHRHIFNLGKWHNFPHQNTCNLREQTPDTHTHIHTHKSKLPRTVRIQFQYTNLPSSQHRHLSRAYLQHRTGFFFARITFFTLIPNTIHIDFPTKNK